MALALAFDDVKANQRKVPSDPHRGTFGSGVITEFFPTRLDPKLPHAVLLQFDPGRITNPHYHGVDQFQVLIEGKGKMGRHDLVGYSIHFSRAYTPYGPFVSDPETGMLCFNLHANTGLDSASHHFPEEKDKLKQVPNRQPWQITSQAIFPADMKGKDSVLQAVPNLKDERGLAAYTLSMKANATMDAPDPSHGDGQYLIVVKGSILQDKKELKAPALIYVYSNDGPFHVQAGSAGVQALVLNFPRSQTRPEDTKPVRSASGSKGWKCGLCLFVYDEVAGMPAEGIAPGTRWEDVPESWSCPDCGASKDDFQIIEQ